VRTAMNRAVVVEYYEGMIANTGQQYSRVYRDSRRGKGTTARATVCLERIHGDIGRECCL
jgi:hypothetical protein